MFCDETTSILALKDFLETVFNNFLINYIKLRLKNKKYQQKLILG